MTDCRRLRQPVRESASEREYARRKELARIVKLVRRLKFENHLDAKMIAMRVARDAENIEILLESWVDGVWQGRICGEIDWNDSGRIIHAD